MIRKAFHWFLLRQRGRKMHNNYAFSNSFCQLGIVNIVNFLPVGEPSVWSEMGVRAFDPSLLSQSISSVLEDGPTFAQPHSSISKVQSPDSPAAVCGAPESKHKDFHLSAKQKTG